MMYQAVFLLYHSKVTTFMFWKVNTTVSTAVGIQNVQWNNLSRKSFWQSQGHIHIVWDNAESWSGDQV